MFKGFKPQGLQKIANSMGYTGSLEGFDSYLQQNPDKQNMMNMYNQRAMQMAQGGAVLRMQQGGSTPEMQRLQRIIDDQEGANELERSQAQDRLNALRNPPKPKPPAPAPKPPAPKPPAAKPPVAKPLAPIAKPIASPVAKPPAPAPAPKPQPQPQPQPGPVGTTKAMGEDGTGYIPDIVGKFPMGEIKTAALGEDDNNPQMPYAEEPLLKNPIFTLPKTQAVGEDDDVVQPIPQPGPVFPDVTTRAAGEEDGSGGIPIGRPVTEAVGEDTGMLPPDMTPYLAKQLRRGGEDFPPFQPPITKTLAEGEDGGFATQPQPLPQQYIPQIDDEYFGVPDETTPDLYADYRQNVERFPETGTFKNPAIQTSFDDMTKELKRNLGSRPSPARLKERSDKVLDYVRNIYSGPIYQSEAGVTGLGAGDFTEEFKQYARDSGLSIVDSPVADGNQLLDAQKGSPIATTPGYLPPAPVASGTTVADITSKLAFNPALPEGATATAVGIGQSPDQMLQPGTGQVSGTVSVPTAMASTTMAEQPGVTDANLMTPEAVAGQVNSSLDSLQAAQTDPNDPRAKVLAAQQTKSAVSDLNAAQGSATLMENPVQREIQDGELISGAADAQKAAKFAEQIQAATATPSEKATVQGQLAQLTQNFDANNPPAWAAGALRGIQGQLAARGLGASSIAGQALIQGALESALPIAQADAQTQAQFESQNLSNRQQRAMLAAQQRAQFIGQEFDQAFQARVQNSARIGDIANMNFTAEQNIALENSRAVNTMNLQNLNNSQAMVMAEASALANMDMANLNNRQQAAVQNAQSFLQMDMANLSNQQQTNLFKAQQRTQALFTDQAATNAARQFNASSQNQVDQFFASLGTQVAQFNATQANAQSQFNAGQANTVERFNAELNNQRDQFNAQNQLVIAQSNAQWRRQIATADTAAINRANELNASALLNISKNAYDNLWTYYADTMEWAWTSAEAELDRLNKLATSNITADAMRKSAEMQADAKAASGLGSLIGSVLGAGVNTVAGRLFKF